jgi:DNA end-binding protein Ku
MPRPIWKGFVSFGLVMIPVTLYSGESPQASLDLDMLDERDLSRIRFRRVNEKSGEEVPWASIVKGYQYEKDRYVILTPEDFKAAAADVVRGGIEIMGFVDRDQISPVYYEKPYYLEPGKNGEKGYMLLREALKKSGRIGIAKVVIQTRQRLAALMVDGAALVLVTMRFPEEVRDAGELKVPPAGTARARGKELEMAQRLVDEMSSDWHPEEYHDEYRAALRRVIEERAKSPEGGPKRRKPVPEAPPESYNLMEMLRKSVEGQKREVGSRRASRRGAPRKKAG